MNRPHKISPCTKKDLEKNVIITDKCKHKINYFIAGLDKEADMKASARLTKSIHKEFNGVLFNALGALKAHFHYR